MLGWLHVTPEGSKQTRSQLEDWPLPEVDRLGYVVNWFFDLRLDFGFQDIESWMNITGNNPNPEEIDLLMLMTGVYRNSTMTYRSKEHDLIPPFDGRTQDQIDTAITEKMKRSLARFK